MLALFLPVKIEPFSDVTCLFVRSELLLAQCINQTTLGKKSIAKTKFDNFGDGFFFSILYVDKTCEYRE